MDTRIFKSGCCLLKASNFGNVASSVQSKLLKTHDINSPKTLLRFPQNLRDFVVTGHDHEGVEQVSAQTWHIVLNSELSRCWSVLSPTGIVASTYIGCFACPGDLQRLCSDQVTLSLEDPTYRREGQKAEQDSRDAHFLFPSRGPSITKAGNAALYGSQLNMQLCAAASDMRFRANCCLICIR